MLVTDDSLVAGRDLVAVVQAAERGGATSVELRLKAATGRHLAETARALLAAIRMPLLLNDRPDVAIAVGAAGVHLGPDDLPIPLARRIAPPGFIIGASVGTLEEALTAREADYWGVGPWRGTTTKADAGAALGADGLRRIVALAGSKPCIAIGGVRPEDAEAVRAAGGAGVAVASGILGAVDVEGAARRYLRNDGR